METENPSQPQPEPVNQLIVENKPPEKKKITTSQIALFISIGSLLVAGANCYNNFLFQSDQTKKWAKINIPKFQWDQRFTSKFKDLSRKTYDTTKWGYRCQVISYPDNSCKIPYYLGALDSTKTKLLPLNPCFTMDEMGHELVAKGYFNGAPSYKMPIFKIYQFNLYIKNIGLTDAVNVLMNVDMQLKNDTTHSWRNVFRSSAPGVINVGYLSKPGFYYYIPVDAIFTDTVFFKMNIKYKDADSISY